MAERVMMHRLLDPDSEERIRAALEKYKSGLEIWWDVVPDAMQMPVVSPDGKPMGVHYEPVLKILIGARGIALGPENFVWYILLENPFIPEAMLENAIIKAVENLQQQRASQLNGPSTAFKKDK